jgi:hypothetical protein
MTVVSLVVRHLLLYLNENQTHQGLRFRFAGFVDFSRDIAATGNQGKCEAHPITITACATSSSDAIGIVGAFSCLGIDLYWNVNIVVRTFQAVLIRCALCSY